MTSDIHSVNYVHTIRNQNAMKKQSQKISVHPRTRVGSARSSFLLPAQQDIFVDIAAPLHEIGKALVPAESLLLPPRVPFDSRIGSTTTFSAVGITIKKILNRDGAVHRRTLYLVPLVAICISFLFIFTKA